MTTRPSPLEGTTLCPDEIVELQCTANNIPADAVRWFLKGHGPPFAVKALLSGNTSARMVLATTPIIPGIKVTLESSFLNQQSHVSFVSKLTTNLTEFDPTEVFTFTCGSLAHRSNSVSLNFTITSPVPPKAVELIATYSSTLYQLHTLTAVWKQEQDPQLVKCSVPYTYSVSLKSSFGAVEVKSVTSDECNGSARNMTCSTEFWQFQSHPGANYAVSIRSSYTPHIDTSFLESVDDSIQDTLNHSVLVTSCELHFSCSHSYHQAQNCTVRVLAENASLESTPSVSIIPLHEFATVRYNERVTTHQFIISVNVNSLVIEVTGLINTTLAIARVPASTLSQLITGLTIWLITASLLLTIVVLSRKLYAKVSQVQRIVVICGFLLGVSSVLLTGLLWAASGFQIGLQDDTCSAKWISARNRLVISAQVTTATAFLLILMMTVTLCCAVNKDKIMDFWNKLASQENTCTDSEDRGIELASMPCDPPFYMKQNQVYKQETFEGNSEASGVDSHLYYLTQSSEHQDDQLGYSEIGERGMENRHSAKVRAPCNSIGGRNVVVKLEGQQSCNPQDAESTRIFPAQLERRNDSSSAGFCEHVTEQQSGSNWLYATIPSGIYDFPHGRGGVLLHKRGQQATQEEEEAAHQYDVVPEERGTDVLLSPGGEGDLEPTADQLETTMECVEHKYINQSGSQRFTRPRQYVNKRMEKGEWPYGYVA